MFGDESELREALRSAEMNVAPDPAHVGAVRERMAVVARKAIADRRRTRNAWIVVLLLCGAGGAALGATEAGRSLVRWILTPVLREHAVTVTTSDGTTWVRGGSTEPYGPEERQAAADQFAEITALAQGGHGELVGLLEGPERTTYLIRYTLEDGSSMTAAIGVLSEKQAANMRIEEILRLYDSGAGDVIVKSPSPLGLGFYVIRFTLPDRTVDLETWYPRGPRAEREAIFVETRLLKAAGLFTVERASIRVENPEEGVWGTLRYTLADGRTVGIVERVPDELITPDGAHVAVPGTAETVRIDPGGSWTAPDGSTYSSISDGEPDSPEEQRETLDRFREVYAIKAAGGGQLVGLIERPGLDGEPELSDTTYQVRYTLAGGETETINAGRLSGPQRVNMRIDEILRLRDEGAGEIISQGESRRGLGSFTIRFTLADGETVDLHTVYPPGTDQERQAIFAEIRALKAQRCFTVKDPLVGPSGVWGLLVYTLADGRSVSHFEQVPTDLITSDGRHIVTPGTGELIEIAGTGGE